MSYLPELFESRDYATTIKVLDSMASEAQGPALASLLCNRALCYQKMDLHRKALKNYDEAVKAHATFARAHLGRGKALSALGRLKEAQAAWKTAIEGFSPADDLQLVEDAFALLRGPEAPPQAPAGPKPAQAAVAPTPAIQKPVQQVVNGAAAQRSAAGPRGRQAVPDTSMAVAMAVGHINGGRVEDALQMLDEVIKSSSNPNMGALVARGTARALKRDLDGAIEDFTGAIGIYPSYGDAWKRRGQAKSANGDRDGALKDFQRALELVADGQGQAEIRAECAMIFQKDRDLRRAAEELRRAVKLDERSAAAWNHLGLCCTGLGDIEDGCAAYRRAIALDPKHADAWCNMAQARKEAAQVEEAEAAFKEVFSLLKPGPKGSHVRRVYSHMKQGLGDHMAAVRVLDEALEKAEGPIRVDCLFLRGACYHALGYHKAAVSDYRQAFLMHEEGLPEETRQQQVLAFFQRELALHAFSHLDDPVASYSLDREIPPVFKELWCKKMPPSQAQLPACQLQHLQIPGEADGGSGPPELPDAAQVAQLVSAADRIGALLQNRHQGFLPSGRQQRMGGLAAIELAQAVTQLLEARKAGTRLMVSQGATGSPQPHEFGWRDAMDLVVKWRQLSEPNDQVIWVDLLTRSEFEAGFGSHTPIFSGQTKCVRYYMNFGRALALLKEIVAKNGAAFDAHSKPIPLGSQEKQEAVQQASTAGEVWEAIGEDSWVVVPIQSLLHPGEILEGTRLTVVRMAQQPDAYEMSIRTPVTPPRWKQYDAELTRLWEQLLAAMAAGERRVTAVGILTFVYYWYNFMPLARGTAVSGYITLLALFLAADMPITARVPQNYQVDWEAILQRTPEEFIGSLSAWLLPEEALAAPGRPAGDEGEAAGTAGLGEATAAFKDIEHLARRLTEQGALAKPPAGQESKDSVSAVRLAGSLPVVKELIPTLRNRLEVLNGPSLPRL